MKILHLLYESRGDYFGIGGVGIRAYEIYGRLKDRHEITLLCKKYPGAQDRVIDGLRHVFAGAESRSLTKTLLSYAYEAASFVRRDGEKFDLIVEEFSPAVPTFLNSYKKRPVVLQVQGYTGGLYFRKYNPAYASVLYLFEKVRPMFYENFIFISPETVSRFRGMRDKQIEIIPNSISSELLNACPEAGGYVLYFGRIDIYGKGLDLLLEAYTEFFKTFPEIRLVIAGDGRDMEGFKTMVMRLPVEVKKNIELTGWVSGNMKTDVIRGALFVVFPSRHEVQPISLLEQMACGKAVIASDIPELSYITESEAGVSFKSGDAGSLARAMKDLATRKDLAEMGLRGRDLARGYSWDKAALRFEEFLEKTILLQ